MSEFKQVILVRSDLKLPKGKLAAQVAHASVEASYRSILHNLDIFKKWRSSGMAKIVLKVETLDKLYHYIQNAKTNSIPTSIITDAGRTVIAPGTVTCGAIGPFNSEDIDAICSDLKLL